MAAKPSAWPARNCISSPRISRHADAMVASRAVLSCAHVLKLDLWD